MKRGIVTIGRHHWAAGAGALLLAALCTAPVRAATPTVLDCTNTSSGSEWSWKVDFVHSTVHQKPAKITDQDITWSDTDAGPNYDFDRTTGIMTKIFASSTGGNIISDRCVLR